MGRETKRPEYRPRWEALFAVSGSSWKVVPAPDGIMPIVRAQTMSVPLCRAFLVSVKRTNVQDLAHFLGGCHVFEEGNVKVIGEEVGEFLRGYSKSGRMVEIYYPAGSTHTIVRLSAGPRASAEFATLVLRKLPNTAWAQAHLVDQNGQEVTGSIMTGALLGILDLSVIETRTDATWSGNFTDEDAMARQCNCFACAQRSHRRHRLPDPAV